MLIKNYEIRIDALLLSLSRRSFVLVNTLQFARVAGKSLENATKV